MGEVARILLQNGWGVAGAVILWDFWRYATGRAVPLRRYLEMQTDRDYWRESAVHGTHQVTTLVNNKELGLATLEKIESHIEGTEHEVS